LQTAGKWVNHFRQSKQSKQKRGFWAAGNEEREQVKIKKLAIVIGILSFAIRGFAIEGLQISI
jgi:hypothetical protein